MVDNVIISTAQTEVPKPAGAKDAKPQDDVAARKALRELLVKNAGGDEASIMAAGVQKN